MLFIDSDIVKRSPVADLSYAEPIISDLFNQKKRGLAGSAQEVPMFPEGKDGGFYSLPAFIRGKGLAGIKWTTHVRANEPYTKPVILLNALADGRPVALVDGLLISGIRTGGVSLHFYRHYPLPNGAHVLVCGSGHQALWQILALFTAYPNLGCISVWSREQSHARACIKRVGAWAKKEDTQKLRAVKNIEEVVGECALVVGVTSAPEPYLSAAHLKDASYVHIGMNDVMRDAIRSYDHIVCDDFDSGKGRSAQSLFRLYREDPSIAERVTLLEDAPRSYAGGRIMFDAFGLSIFDLGLASAVYDFAREQGLGVHLDLYGKD